MEDAAEVPEGGETGEVRKIRVVYFLSRNGRTEQPHLMRVHHRHRNGGGVRLRDVKRWLSELRGKYLPESHAWSYKRRYKSGYVWLDITDDDLITPVDDNEYVLMGSFIPTVVTLDDEIKNGNTNPAHVSDCHAKSNTNPTPAPTINNDKNISGDNRPPSAFAGVNKSASSSSSSSSKSRKFPDYDDVEMEEEECPRRRLTTYVDVSTQTPTIATFTTFDLLRADVVAKKTIQEKEVGDPVREKSIRSKSTMALGDSRKGAGGEKRVASNMFRNLITCGGSETRDSAMIPFDRRQMVGVAGEKEMEKSEKHRQSKSPPPPPMPESPSTNVDVLEDAKKSRNYNGKHTTLPEPICSECGKSFNPEKLFSHMNSCEVSRRRRRRNSRHQESSLVKREEANNAAVFSLKLYHS